MNRLSFAQSRAGRRLVVSLVAAILLIAMVGASLTLAQDAAPRKLRFGETVTGTLDATNFAQVYTFDAQADSTVTLVATSKTKGLTLALLLTNAAGETLARTSDLAKPEVAIRDFKIAVDGAYYATVIRGTGVQGTQGSFSLALTGAAAAAPGAVTLTQGLTVALVWGTTDNLSLEVRDPVGGAANFRTPSVTSGGHFSGMVNANCVNTTAESPTETISWPSGNVPGGSYEIIVYFNQACPPAGGTAPATEAATPLAASGGPVNFAVTVTVDGKVLEPIRGSLSLNQQYVASFVLAGPDQVTLNPGGPNLGIDLTPFSGKIGSPTALGTRTSTTGTLDRNNPADAWSMQIASNARPITVTLEATSGSLDPFLVLIGPDGNVVASNDDASPTTRNAEIASLTLPEGRYTILATRFALSIGGTEGSYALSINTTGRVSPTAAAAGTGAATPTVAAGTGLPTGFIQVTLIWNTNSDLRLLIRDPNGVSVFSDNRVPDNSGILDRLGNFKCQSTTTTPLTYAYWPTNIRISGTYEIGVWLQDLCNETVLPTYTLTVSVGGKQVINVSDRPDRGGAHYLTTLTIDASGNATQGPGGLVAKGPTLSNDTNSQVVSQIPNAQALTYGQPIRGSVSMTAPFVVYTFEAKAGDKLSISLKNAGGNLDPVLFLLNANGVQINQNDDVKPGEDSNSQIDQTITTDGTYIVVASRYGVELGGTSGNFELSVDKLNK